MRRLLFILLALAGAGFAGFKLVVEPWWRDWGVDPGESDGSLPGDDLVPEAGSSDTRGITIAAAPEAIWPWLMQMGYGRAGWYSYDAIDNAGASASEIRHDIAEMAVGDLVPVAPGTGFQVKVLEENRALVLYADTDLMKLQEESASTAEAPANLKAAGAFMEATQPTDFAASWAFVLRPLPHGRTRLIERVRVSFGASDKPWTRVSLPLMGFGVFVMMRRQLLGLRDRAERHPMPEPEAVPA
jgi:hypothetical protein